MREERERPNIFHCALVLIRLVSVCLEPTLGEWCARHSADFQHIFLLSWSISTLESWWHQNPSRPSKFSKIHPMKNEVVETFTIPPPHSLYEMREVGFPWLWNARPQPPKKIARGIFNQRFRISSPLRFWFFLTRLWCQSSWVGHTWWQKALSFRHFTRHMWRAGPGLTLKWFVDFEWFFIVTFCVCPVVDQWIYI